MAIWPGAAGARLEGVERGSQRRMLDGCQARTEHLKLPLCWWWWCLRLLPLRLRCATTPCPPSPAPGPHNKHPSVPHPFSATLCAGAASRLRRCPTAAAAAAPAPLTAPPATPARLVLTRRCCLGWIWWVPLCSTCVGCSAMLWPSHPARQALQAGRPAGLLSSFGRVGTCPALEPLSSSCVCFPGTMRTYARMYRSCAAYARSC